MDNGFFTPEEKELLRKLYQELAESAGDAITGEDSERLKKYLARAVESGKLHRNIFGLNPVCVDIQTAVIAAQ